MTLSHCWDGGSVEYFSNLNTSNRHQWVAGVCEEELPTKFRDAITVTRWMKVQYLWIDAVCIIQDSGEDWRMQSSVMGDIYAGSYRNIAAMSKPGEDGFLRERRIEVIEPFLIRDLVHTSHSTTHVLGYDDFWCSSLLSQPLHNRAWVLQERQMSPRTIHFGEQIFWECREHKACEAYPTGIPEEFTNHRTRAWSQGLKIFHLQRQADHQEPNQSWLGSLLTRLLPRKIQRSSSSPEEAHQYWSDVVERYMECDLTKSLDKLVAIEGLANKVSDVTGERYLAGHWDNANFAHSLLWYSPAKEQGNGAASVKYLLSKQNYRAPSWSWASLDGKILWKWPAEHDRLLVEVKANLHMASNNFPMEVHLYGTLLAVSIEIAHYGADGRPDEDGSYAVIPKEGSLPGAPHAVIADAILGARPTILFDEALIPSCAIDAYLLPIVTGWGGRPGQPVAAIAGLVVAQSLLGANVVYERVGAFCLDSKSPPGDTSRNGSRDLETAFTKADTALVTLV